MKVTNRDGEICLRVDVFQGKDAAELHEMLWAWQEQSAKLEEITRGDYDRWRYRFPEFDTTQIRAKVPSQEPSDMLLAGLKEEQDK